MNKDMNRIIFLSVLLSIEACTPKPARPPDLSGARKEAFDACEKTYAQCLTGKSDTAPPAGQTQAGFRNDPMPQTVVTGDTSCNKQLKRCYERAQPSPTPNPK
jgi:hypothetical protein